MTKRKGIPDDGIQELIEWEEHQYNKGYWINRFTPFFPPKKTKGNWILSLIDLVIATTIFIGLLVCYFQDPEGWMILPLIVVGLLTFGIILRTKNLKPIDNRDNELDAEISHDHEHKKKLSKRRKDYH